MHRFTSLLMHSHDVHMRAQAPSRARQNCHFYLGWRMLINTKGLRMVAGASHVPVSRCGATWQGRGVYWAPEANTNTRH